LGCWERRFSGEGLGCVPSSIMLVGTVEDDNPAALVIAPIFGLARGGLFRLNNVSGGKSRRKWIMDNG
jgi:hypothetical protein